MHGGVSGSGGGGSYKKDPLEVCLYVLCSTVSCNTYWPYWSFLMCFQILLIQYYI